MVHVSPDTIWQQHLVKMLCLEWNDVINHQWQEFFQRFNTTSLVANDARYFLVSKNLQQIGCNFWYWFILKFTSADIKRYTCSILVQCPSKYFFSYVRKWSTNLKSISFTQLNRLLHGGQLFSLKRWKLWYLKGYCTFL